MELLSGELHVVFHDDGVRDFKAMDDVEEEQHGLLGFDRGDRRSFYPFCELVYGDKKVGVAPGHLLERPNQIEPLDHEGPCDGDHLECMLRGEFAECSTGTLRRCVRSAQRWLLRWASRSPIKIRSQPRF